MSCALPVQHLRKECNESNLEVGGGVCIDPVVSLHDDKALPVTLHQTLGLSRGDVQGQSGQVEAAGRALKGGRLHCSTMYL